MIWFKISSRPGQIQAFDFYTAVLAYGLEVAHGVVVEVAVHMIYHELSGIFASKSTTITGGFFLVTC
jgi:hypothetical protein